MKYTFVLEIDSTILDYILLQSLNFVMAEFLFVLLNE